MIAPATEWRSVVGSDGKYEVSNTGLVRSVKNLRLLKGSRSSTGYVVVYVGRMSATGNRARTSVHRLVLASFVGPANGLHANHINGIRNDNRIENLEWVTPRENMRHSIIRAPRNVGLSPIASPPIETIERVEKYSDPSLFTLSDKQASILLFIVNHTEKNKVPPTIREIGKAFHISSPNGVMCHLRALVAKGKLAKARGLSRAYVPIQGPKCPHCGCCISPEAAVVS